MNSVDNLRWVSSYENMTNRDYDGVRKANGKQIVQLDMNGKFIAEYNSIEEAGKKFGCSAHIRKCAKHKTEMAYGYKWEYKEKGGD